MTNNNMNRLTSHDKNWGPITIARWRNTLSAEISSGDSEDPENTLLLIACGWALRVHLPRLLKPAGKYGEDEKLYGFSITSTGDEKGWDYLNVHYGRNSLDSSTQKRWGYFFPWKQWRHVRHSYYNPDGTHFADQPRSSRERRRIQEEVPKVYFELEDYDGTRTTATCNIEEREWHFGEKAFKWLRHFRKPKIYRSLNLWFSDEVGKGKGSWKGGIIGTSCEMLPGDTPESAFRRYCEKEQRNKEGNSHIKFIGPCEAPAPRPEVKEVEP